MTLLSVLGMVAALLFGIYLGLPARYQPDAEEIEEALSDPDRERKKARRHMTFLGLLQRTHASGSQRRMSRRGRRPFDF
jgi:hypothetical protein